jgi:hypothetical protein
VPSTGETLNEPPQGRSGGFGKIKAKFGRFSRSPSMRYEPDGGIVEWFIDPLALGPRISNCAKNCVVTHRRPPTPELGSQSRCATGLRHAP